MKYAYVVANILARTDDKILIVKKKGRDFWILPGGKRQEETLLACLLREISEELPLCSIKGHLDLLDEFDGFSPKEKWMKVILFGGCIEGNITPGAEIEDARWVPEKDIFSYPLSELTATILQKLLAEKGEVK